MGERYRGTAGVSGAKNGALPALAAALLTEEPAPVRNVPAIRDAAIMPKMLRRLGAGVEISNIETLDQTELSSIAKYANRFTRCR